MEKSSLIQIYNNYKNRSSEGLTFTVTESYHNTTPCSPIFLLTASVRAWVSLIS